MARSKDLAIKLSEAIALGDWRYYFWFQHKMNQVTLLKVREVFKKYFIESNRTMGVFMPIRSIERAHIPKEQGSVKELDSLKEDETILEGEEFIADVKNIEKLVKRKNISSNIASAILSKSTRGKSLEANFIFRFADEEHLTKYRYEFSLLPALLLRGTKKLDYQGVRDKLDSLMSSITIHGHGGSIQCRINSDQKNIVATIDLLSQMLLEPRLEKKEFDLLQKREIDDLEEMKSDPQRIGFNELERLKNPHDKLSLLYNPTFDEKILALSTLRREVLKEAYDKFFSPNNCFMSIVGDVVREEVEDAMVSLFPVKMGYIPYKRIKNPFIKNLCENRFMDTEDKEMAIIAWGANFPMRDDHEDYVFLKLANYIFGEHMNSRLMNRIREREGISYGAGSWLDISRRDEHASINIYAMASPQKVYDAENAMLEEWLLMLSDGMKDDELSDAKESIWLSFKNYLANDHFLSSALAHDLEVNRDFRFREDMYLKIKDISQKDIKRVMGKWWGELAFSKVIAGDGHKMKK